MAPPARRRYVARIAARPGNARSQGKSGVLRRIAQRKRTRVRRAGAGS